jgi:serine/threonine protein kinase
MVLVDATRREMEVMKALQHRNIVSLLEVIDDPDDANLYLVMPYCDRGPILKLSQEGTCVPIDIDVARGYMRHITAGLAYLHSQHVAHMDVKPDNILLDSAHRVYLSDFGTSDFFKNDDQPHGLRGTPAFAAPETLSSKTAPFNPFPADIWSLGVTLYAMLFGRLPFRGDTLPALAENITHGDVTYDAPPDGADAAVSSAYADAIDLLLLMLCRDPSGRPTAAAVKNHPFLAGREVAFKKKKGASQSHRVRDEKARKKLLELTIANTTAVDDTAPLRRSSSVSVLSATSSFLSAPVSPSPQQEDVAPSPAFKFHVQPSCPQQPRDSAFCRSQQQQLDLSQSFDDDCTIVRFVG